MNQEIRAYWDDRARRFGTDCVATLRETRLRRLEISALARRLAGGQSVLDVGCGNGYSVFQFASLFRSNFYGLDFSKPMIDAALEHKRMGPPLRGNTAFYVGDVTNIPCPSNMFDVATSGRCLQNLTSWEMQQQAIDELLRVVRPGGKVILAECSVTGVEQMNKLRRRLGKPPLRGTPPWHNVFLDDGKIRALASTKTAVASVEIEHYASSYMLITRILEVGHRWADRIPNLGSLGYFKLYVLTRTS